MSGRDMRLDADIYGAQVLLLRAETLVGHSYENTLRSAGHPVTVISSREAAFSLIETMRPDMVVFDPISEFGFAGSVQRLCASFDGPIVATGLDKDSPMAARLQHLGISLFAANVADLLEIARNIPASNLTPRKTAPRARQPKISQPSSRPTAARARIADDNFDREKPESAPASGKRFPERWHWATAGIATAIVAVAVVVVALVLPGPTEDAPVAKALPVIPRILLRPLVPLTIEELSGDTLPLKIFGITDREVIEGPAVAFWGDTAPDAFVTVNGKHVEVSEYGAFVVDIPLEDGANFIEVLASDFLGRTTRASFTLVRTQ
ncbi:MAG: hypothetical protein J4O01_09230 [Chloroflexi bacterium]|nr:hypothetical protein [Chloroflexota bacterium]